MTKTIIDEIAAYDLELYIENDYYLYETYIVPYLQSLHKKHIKGTYNKEKALIGWERIATYGAKKYQKDFLNVPYYRVFNKATREETARYLQEFFLDMVCEGV